MDRRELAQHLLAIATSLRQGDLSGRLLAQCDQIAEATMLNVNVRLIGPPGVPVRRQNPLTGDVHHTFEMPLATSGDSCEAYAWIDQAFRGLRSMDPSKWATAAAQQQQARFAELLDQAAAYFANVKLAGDEQPASPRQEGVQWSAPMSKSAIARRILGDPSARERKIRRILKRLQITQSRVGRNAWVIRLDLMEPWERQNWDAGES